MEMLWKGAFAIAGVGGIAAFVLWSLYKRWLELPIFQTLTKQHQYQLFRLFLILTFLFAIAGLVAFVVTASPTGIEPEIQFRVIDSKTGQPIHQQILVEYRRGPRTYTETTTRGVTERIPGDFDEITVTKLANVKGYLLSNMTHADDPTLRLRTFSLDRDPASFAKAIRPSEENREQQIVSSDMDDTDKYLAEMARIPATPPKVVFKCRNNSTDVVDIFWYRYVPKELRSEAGFLPGWTHPVTCPPTNGKIVTIVEDVAINPGGYFYVYGSRNGLEGEYLTRGNFFRTAVALLEIDPKPNASDNGISGRLIHQTDDAAEGS